ncbi:MAG: alpha-2-macroglobulin family protein, partial [Bacteroidota bacterium]|nr:alpha-2-macroglobulin family protein [Bacteroidota bacterium]
MKAKFFFLASLLGILMLGAGFTSNHGLQQSAVVVIDGGDYEKLWEEVQALTEKGLPKSALEIVDNIYTKAKKENNAPQFIKAVIYQMRLHSDIEENYFVKAIHKLNTELSDANEPMKQVLHSVLAEMYMAYYQANRYKLLNRSITVAYDAEDLETWDIEKIMQTVIKHYLASLEHQDLLKDITLEDFDPILETEKGSRQFRPTLYDFLAHRAVDYFMQDENSLTQPANRFEINKIAYLNAVPDFVNVEIATADSLSLRFYALEILQDLIRFHIPDKNPGALIDVDVKRLQFVRSNAILEDKDSLYLDALSFLQDTYGDFESSAEVSYHIARFYYDRGQLYNPLDSDKYKWDVKKAYELIEAAIKKFPDAFGTANCKDLKTTVLKKAITITTHYANIPSKAFPGLLSYKNVPGTYFRVFPLDYQQDKELKQNFRREDLVRQYLKHSPVKEWKQELVDDGDFQNHNVEIRLPELPFGYYIILASSNEDFSFDNGVLSYAGFWCSNLSYISQRRDDGSVDFYVLDREKGSAMKDVHVQTYYQQYDYNQRKYKTITGDEFSSDETGLFNIPTVSGQANRLMLEFTYQDDKFVTPNYFYQQRVGHKEVRKTARTFFFTDRAIYRPGQSVYFKGILLEKEADQYSILKDHQTKVTFNDVNGQQIAELDLSTNEFGSFKGSFVAPIGVLTGNMRIRNESGSISISVEEYRRPKFEVVFEPVKGAYKLNEQLSIKGKALAYSGNSIDHANVKYRVVRRAMFPFWRYPWSDFYPVSAEMEIVNGTTQTDNDGSFSIDFTAIPDKSLNRKFKPAFNFTIYADVTDINGETHSGQQNVAVGYNALLLDVNIPETLNIEEAGEFLIRSSNLNGVFEPTDVSVTISRLQQPERLIREREWTRPDVFLLSEEEFIREFPNDAYGNEDDQTKWERAEVILEQSFHTSKDSILDFNDIKDLKQGDYVISLRAKDKFGQEVELEKYFTAFSTASKSVPVHAFNWFSMLKSEAEPGEEVEFLIGTKEKHVHIIYEVTKGKELLNRSHFIISNEQKLFKLPVLEAYRGNIGISLTFISKNRSYQNKAIIRVPHSDKELDISFASFRNKLIPGQEEEWQIKVTDKKGELAAAELMAGMYDASLDAFKTNRWAFSLYRSLNQFSTWNINDAFLTSTSHMHVFPVVHSTGPRFHTYDRLNWFGLRMYHYPQIMRKSGGERLDVMQAMTSQPGEPTMDGGGNQEKEEIQDEEIAIPVTAQAAPQFSGIQIRRDFRETAFFYPDLRTDSEGNVILRFTVPETMTRWRMMGLAYTTDLKVGQIEKELITQKQLMVVPNPPRFFRQGDKMAFSSKIVNLSDKTLIGEVYLEFFDAITMQAVHILDTDKPVKQSFEVSKGMSKAIEWAISIPDHLDALTYRIVARAGQYSDGEEMAIPVLTNRMLVTESLPLPISGKGSKEFKFDKLINYKSSTARNFKLTLEFTSNPAWYAVQALPYLMDYPYESSDQIFSRYYANSIASHIANSNPRIKRVFESWKHLTPDALLSNLEKNQELKSVILQETPWVLQAQSESERKQRIGLLFDLNHMANSLTGALA